ncbi:hypothetical protein OROGR_006479 [Orobanche gracilis]
MEVNLCTNHLRLTTSSFSTSFPSSHFLGSPHTLRPKPKPKPLRSPNNNNNLRLLRFHSPRFVFKASFHSHPKFILLIVVTFSAVSFLHYTLNKRFKTTPLNQPRPLPNFALSLQFQRDNLLTEQEENKDLPFLNSSSIVTEAAFITNTPDSSSSAVNVNDDETSNVFTVSHSFLPLPFQSTSLQDKLPSDPDLPLTLVRFDEDAVSSVSENDTLSAIDEERAEEKIELGSVSNGYDHDIESPTYFTMGICHYLPLGVMVRSESSYVVPPCHVEIIPLPQGEVDVDSYRAVFRGRIDIRCTYPDSHRTILPRRSTVSAIYTMHIPAGRPLASSTDTRRRIEPSQHTPRATARRSVVGPPTNPPGFAERSSSIDLCQCFRCLQKREGHAGSSAPAAREVPKLTPGPSSRRVRRRTMDDESDSRGQPKRAWLSSLPQSPAPRTRLTLDGVIVLSSDEEDSEEDPKDEEFSDEGL